MFRVTKNGSGASCFTPHCCNSAVFTFIISEGIVSVSVNCCKSLMCKISAKAHARTFIKKHTAGKKAP